MGDDNPPKPSSNPSQRLSQVAAHITPSSKQRKPRKKTKNALPADYSDILTNLTALRTLAQTPSPTNPGYVRQKQAGKLWVRERVLALLDPNSFHEIGSATGTVTWRSLPHSNNPITEEEPIAFTPSNNVQGFGTLRGRKVVFTADDFSIRAGHADGALMSKTLYIEQLAIALRLPILKLVDGSSGGGSVTTIMKDGYAYIPPMPTFRNVVTQLNMGIPNLGAVLGPAIGLGAARVVACHFSVMAGDVGSLINAGPKVVAGATGEEGLSLVELGGPDVHCANGTIDNLAEDEEGCFEQLRTILGFLPNSGASLPPVVQSKDSIDRKCEDLRTIIPRRKARTYDARKIIRSVMDSSSFFEIGALWGQTAIVGLAHLAGRPVGVISLDCEVNAGALDALGAQKITRHLKLCDVFNLPVVQFIDVPGYAIGTVAERTATMRHGVALATTYFATTMPVFSVVVRRVYGVAGGIMVDCREPRMRVAWPSGEWGSLPLEGGIEVGHAAELRGVEEEGRREEEGRLERDGNIAEEEREERVKKAGKKKRQLRYKELEAEYTRLMNPVRTANAFGVEEIIDPADTRRVVAAWVVHVYEALLPIRLLERANGKICPVFY